MSSNLRRDGLKSSEGSFWRAVEWATRQQEPPWSLAANDDWIRASPTGRRIPSQGWKIHVSATIVSADEVLQAALPVLVAKRASFKVARSTARLADLNEGNGGLSQVGKFITAYPDRDTSAVALAHALHEATNGLPSPSIPSDRRLLPGSAVHYRYGVFDGQMTQNALGQFVSMLQLSDGSTIPDRRSIPYRSPAGQVDPFVAAGIASEEHERSPLVAGRYLRVTPLSASARGFVHLGVDVQQERACVIKSANQHALVDEHGRDARERLEWEAHVLLSLEGDPCFPTVYAFITEGDECFLVMEDLGGNPLERVVAERATRGDCLTPYQIRRLGLELFRIVETLHSAGLVYRDLKSPNLIVTRTGGLALVDFESVIRAGDTVPPHTKGTRGYMSPQAHAGCRPAFSDDIYGVGAVLYFAATGAEPSQSPDALDLPRRPVRRLNPAINAAVEAVIFRCLDHDPERRFGNARDASAALEAALDPRCEEPATRPCDGASEPYTRQAYEEMASRLMASICAAAVPDTVTDGLTWNSRHPTARGVMSRDLNSGAAGTVLALAELVENFPDERASGVLAKGARALAYARPTGPRLPGLYVGEAGVATALLRAGQVLDNAEMIDIAVERSRSVAKMPHSSPDLFNGTAGRLRFHLFLWCDRPRAEHLEAAVLAGEYLLSTAERSEERTEYWWSIPEGYGEMSGEAPLGYAHGTAGIADALLDLYEVQADGRLLDAARAAGRWLASRALPMLDGGTGLGWPANEGQPPTPAFWCHGAAGIGRFFLHLWKVTGEQDARAVAEGAGQAVATATRWAGPTLCHGLSGNIEYLLDLFVATQEELWLFHARELARILEAFSDEVDGYVMFPSETPGEFTPDYMVGYGGVALTYLRLTDPERTATQLTLEAFRRAGGVGHVRGLL